MTRTGIIAEEEDIMTRRGSIEGSIVKRADGRWMARIYLPDGRRKCVYGQTRQETAQRMTTIPRDCTVGLPVADERLTVERYLMEWLEVSARPSVRDSTFRSYSVHVRLATSCHPWQNARSWQTYSRRPRVSALAGDW